ncbi:MAG: hypothetical protein ACT4PZ_07470 [Panacagrimonas sp.]
MMRLDSDLPDDARKMLTHPRGPAPAPAAPKAEWQATHEDPECCAVKQLLKKMPGELPRYLAYFAACLVRPQRFLTENLGAPPELEDEQVQRSLSFLLWSLLIALLLGIALPQVWMPQTPIVVRAATIQAGSRVMLDSLEFIGAAATIYLAWRTVGVRSRLGRFMTIAPFFCGVALVLVALRNAASHLAILDPLMAKAQMAMQQATTEIKPLVVQLLCAMAPGSGAAPAGSETLPDAVVTDRRLALALEAYTQAMSRPLPSIANGLRRLLGVVMVLWMSFAWVAYARCHKVSTARAFVAAVLGALAMFCGGLLFTAMEAGADVLAIFRGC